MLKDGDADNQWRSKRQSRIEPVGGWRHPVGSDRDRPAADILEPRCVDIEVGQEEALESISSADDWL